MAKTRHFIAAVFVLLASAAVMALPAAAQSRQVYAFYFGWWTSSSWGDGRLHDHPLQPYESLDAGAVGRQIAEAQSAGIDAFVMDWYGPKDDNLTNHVFNILLDQAAGRGFHAAALVNMQQSNYNTTVDEVLVSLRYLIGDRVNHPAYLRYNGKPVIYFWNQGRFAAADWETVRAQIDPERRTIWVMEGTDTSYLKVFDSLYLFNVAWSGDAATTAIRWRSAALQGGTGFYTPTVMPGWDESALEGRPNPTDPQERADGEFLVNSWNGAVASGAPTIIINSWNEYFENSHVEPSQVHGTAALDTLRGLIGAWESGAPAPALVAAESQPSAPQQPPAAAAPAGNPTGVKYLPNDRINLRAAPTTDAGVITQIPYGVWLDVIGRSADSNWVQVNYDGGSGWVAAWVGQFDGDLNGVPVSG